MDEHPTPDPVGQPSHLSIIVDELGDGCRLLVFLHSSEPDRIRLLRAARSAGISLPDDLEEGMHRLGEIGKGGQPPLDFDAYLDTLHRAFDRLKQRPASRRPTHADCCHEIEEEYERSKKRFRRHGTSWRKETRNW